MDSKLFIIEALKGLVSSSHNNGKCNTKTKNHPKSVSKNKLYIKTSENKEKNASELPKSTVRIFELFQILKIDKGTVSSGKKAIVGISNVKKHSKRSDCDKAIRKTNEKEKKLLKTMTSNFLNFHSTACNEISSCSNEHVSEAVIKTDVQEWINSLSSSEKNCTENEEMYQNYSTPQAIENIHMLAAKLSREASVQSSSSLDSFLVSRRPDPVEIFLNLGFGGAPGLDINICRIPRRFLVPSKCKGGDWNEFLQRELIQAQNFECSSLGFRGLSGPSHRRPSAIVASIIEKLRERSISQPYSKSRFSSVVKRVLNEKSILKLTSDFQQSVLSPDSQKFLQNQGKVSPEVPRRRIIFGQKSFAFARDGELVEMEDDEDNAIINCKQNEETNVNPSDMLLKERRLSLQKHKMNGELNGKSLYIVKSDGKLSDKNVYSSEPPSCSRKVAKIPRRFLSSSSLKNPDIESNIPEIMRREVEREIKCLSQKIKNVNDRDLACVLRQVKQLRETLEEKEKVSFTIES